MPVISTGWVTSAGAGHVPLYPKAGPGVSVNMVEPSALADQWAGTVCAVCLKERCKCSTVIGTAHPRNGDPRFYRLIDEIASLHARKSQDYAPGADPLANFKASAGVGVRPYSGILTRLLDKWGRIATAAKGGALLNESLRDSHIDSAVYHLLAVLLLEDETKG